MPIVSALARRSAAAPVCGHRTPLGDDCDRPALSSGECLAHTARVTRLVPIEQPAADLDHHAASGLAARRG